MGYVADPVIARIAQRRWKKESKTSISIISDSKFSNVKKSKLCSSQNTMLAFSVWLIIQTLKDLTKFLASRGIEAVLLYQINSVKFLQKF